MIDSTRTIPNAIYEESKGGQEPFVGMGYMRRCRSLDRTVLIWFSGTYVALYVTWLAFEWLRLTVLIQNADIGSTKGWVSVIALAAISLFVLLRKIASGYIK